MAEEFWEQAAKQDPLWAILSDPTKRDRGWDVASFFESGQAEIAQLDARLRQLGRVPRHGRALDFGCGVGRLTQALAPSFDEVIGIDASPTMIELARKLNRHGDKVRYVLNTAPVLEPIASNSIDLLYTDIVLQHLEPARAIRYVADFMRVLAPGGIAVFQLPSRKRTPREVPDRPVPMEPDAYRADVRIAGGMPETMTAGSTALARVRVRNTSGVRWNQARTGIIRLGNHWLSAGGEMLIQDDGRAALPADTSGVVDLELAVKAPPDAGDYICEFDLVHEGVTWFRERGLKPVQVRVPVTAKEVEPETKPSAPVEKRDVEFPDIYTLLPPPADAPIAAFPMFGVSRAIVTELIRSTGGELFQVDDDERGGPEWESHMYFVAKRELAQQ